MTDLLLRPAHELAGLLATREIRAGELVRALLDRIESLDPRVRAYLTVDGDGALEQAREADRRLAGGEGPGPLCGVPVAIKDNICTAGLRTTCGSRILEHWVPPYDATVVARLRQAGAVIIGKTNLDEFAMGSSTENSAFGPSRNPWDLERVPGGSSGGSAAAVAAGLAPLALGSDTGGSVRQPAAFCGIVGLKPTYGRVSRYGLVAFASSLDQIGPMTGTVADCALLLEAIAGFDPRDSTSVDVAAGGFRAALDGRVKGLRVGLPRSYFAEDFGDEVSRAVLGASRLLAGMGVEVEVTDLPHTPYALDAYYIIAPAEASSNLARYDGIRYGHRAEEPQGLADLYGRTRARGFGPEVKRRIMLGTYALSSGYYEAYYLKAQQVRTLVKGDFDAAWRKFDVLLTPTSPVTAFRLGERTEDPLAMYLADVCTIPVNLAGLPAISVPAGFDAAGLPIGLQVIGRPFDEATVLKVAHAFERATGYHLRRPPLALAAAARAGGAGSAPAGGGPAGRGPGTGEGGR